VYGFARRLTAASGPPTTISISIDVAGPLGMRLGRVDGQLQVVTVSADGWAGATKALTPGDSLRLLNGAPCDAAKLKEALTSGSRPLRLGFERFDGGGGVASDTHTRVFEVQFSGHGKLGMSFGVVDGELHVVKAAKNAEAHPSEPVLAGDVLVGVNGAPAAIAVVKKALLSGERPLKLAVRRVATFAFGAAAAAGGRGGGDAALALSPVERAALAGAAATEGATLPLASLTKEQVLAFARYHEVDSLLGGLSAHKVDGAVRCI
jgi:hypothetical protein